MMTPAIVRVGQGLVQVGDLARRCSAARRLGGVGHRIDHVLQRQARMGGGVARVDLADAAGADQGEC